VSKGSTTAVRGIVVLADAHLLKRVRQAHPQRLILVVLGRDERACVPGLLDAGADAVLLGRSRDRELLARARVLMRADAAQHLLRSLPTLSRVELELFALLLADPRRVVSRREMIDACWAGDPPPGAARTIDRQLARLRATARSCGLVLVTVWGVGYRLEHRV